MYKPGTLLSRKEPIKDNAYNRVEVISPSPIDYSTIQTEWTGTGAQGILIRPLDGFGGVLDEPFGKLQELYNVDSIPETVPAWPPKLTHVVDSTTPEAGKTPEEVFAEQAHKPARKGARNG